MNGEPDDNVIDIPRPKSSILESLKSAASPGPDKVPERHQENTDSAGSEDGEPLPQPGDPYKAHSRSTNKPIPMIRFLCGDTVRGFPYANLDSIDLLPADHPGGGPVIVIRFAGIIAREAKLKGRQMALLFDMITYHRIAWVRELPKGKDFKGGGETVITGITIAPITKVPD